MKKYFVLGILALGLNAQNQEDVLVQSYYAKEFFKEKPKLLVSMYTDLEANAQRSITNSFVNTLVFKSYVDESAKDNVVSRLKSLNHVGLYGNEGLSVKYKLDSTMALGVHVNNTDLLTSSISSDFFKLVFKGNADFAGQTAQLSNSRIGYLNYQTIGLSFEKKWGKSIYGAGISYVTVGQYQNHVVDRGQLFTAEDGTYIDFSANMTLQSSGNDASSRYFNNIGSGTALNLSYRYASASEKLLISADLKDLGFANVKYIDSYQKDSSYHFSGVHIDNLFEFKTDEFGQFHTDTLYELLKMKKERITKSQILPFRAKVALQYHINDKLSVLSDLQYLYTAHYLPKVSLGGAYSFCPRFAAFAKLSAGGFGFVDSQIGFNTVFPGRIHVYASANILENLLAARKTSGSSLNVVLSRIF